MKKINAHLVFVVLSLIAIVIFNQKYGKETFVFFGLAENKEMEIRLEHPIRVEQVHVSPGQKVKAGELLLTTTRSGMALTQSDLTHDIARLESELKLWESQLTGSINELRAQRMARESEIKSQIEQLESGLSINQTLLDGLESIHVPKDKNSNSPAKLKIEGLKNDLLLAVKPLDAQISKLNQELHAPENPIRIQVNRLKSELGFVHQDEAELNLYAQSDGVVGNLFCKAGEQIAAFNTLLIFYEENPTEVKAYVLESLLLQVSVGDSLFVHSTSRYEAPCMGEVIGLGTRIVEIPERLRKNPAFITYGREVQIKIPSNNAFLQKEKVSLKPYHSSTMRHIRQTVHSDVEMGVGEGS
jgi:multidrug resistance efflux pump